MAEQDMMQGMGQMPPPEAPTATTKGKKKEALRRPSSELVPGISLTSDPDDPKPWERPPEFVTYHEATEYMVDRILSKEAFGFIMGLIRDGIPISVVTEMVVKQGVFHGKYNVDIMLLIIEPIMILLVGMAEKLGIDYVFEEEELDDTQTSMIINKFKAPSLRTQEDVTEDMASKSDSVNKEKVDDQIKSLLGGNVLNRVNKAVASGGV